MIPFGGLVIGIILGVIFQPSVPEALQPYAPVAIVAALDAVVGAARALGEKRFDDRVFVISFLSNVLIAVVLVYLGDQLGVGTQLSSGVIIVLGIRIFANAASIRRRYLHG